MRPPVKLEIVGINGKPLIPKDKCTVHMNGKSESFTEFVAINIDATTGSIRVMHNTDAATLGIAVECLLATVKAEVAALPEDMQAELLDYFTRRGYNNGQDKN